MSADVSFTKENLDSCFKELGKAFRKRNGAKMPAEIILIGGAAILANYGFREMTYDIDAIIIASSAMKEAINDVSDKLGLPNRWINTDFKKTSSFSGKLIEVSKYYKTFSNILTIRTISSEYLIAMKLMSGRQYKNDLSDIAGILWEHQQKGLPINRRTIDRAVITLYGKNAKLPSTSLVMLDNAFNGNNFNQVYKDIRESEEESKKVLLNFDKAYPGKIADDNVDEILAQAKAKRGGPDIKE